MAADAPQHQHHTPRITHRIPRTKAPHAPQHHTPVRESNHGPYEWLWKWRVAEVCVDGPVRGGGAAGDVGGGDGSRAAVASVALAVQSTWNWMRRRGITKTGRSVQQLADSWRSRPVRRYSRRCAPHPARGLGVDPRRHRPCCPLLCPCRISKRPLVLSRAPSMACFGPHLCPIEVSIAPSCHPSSLPAKPTQAPTRTTHHNTARAGGAPVQSCTCVGECAIWECAICTLPVVKPRTKTLSKKRHCILLHEYNVSHEVPCRRSILHYAGSTFQRINDTLEPSRPPITITTGAYQQQQQLAALASAQQRHRPAAF